MRKNFSISDLAERYRTSEKAFTRKRKLPFHTVCLLILQKSAKSLKNRLNEFFEYSSVDAASASAFTQARRYLKHEVFIDFNRDGYAEAFYTGEHKRYKGHRLLAIDASRLRLPETDEIREEFGASRIRLKNSVRDGSFAAGFCSVLYDVLNENVIDSTLTHVRAGGRSVAQGHIGYCREKDLVVLDRGYPGFEIFSSILAKKADFICRCASNSFQIVEDFISERELQTKIVSLLPWKGLRPRVRRGELPEEIRLRLLKVELPSGETEILATSLLDESRYSRQDIAELYRMRWGVETYFDRLKNRLALENFTGKTVESVKQDFYSTILVSNLESEIAKAAADELENKTDTMHRHKVNKAVSYNAVKDHVIELLMCDDCDLEELTEKLEAIFLRHTIPIRPNRSFERKRSARKSLHYHQRQKKVVY